MQGPDSTTLTVSPQSLLSTGAQEREWAQERRAPFNERCSEHLLMKGARPFNERCALLMKGARPFEERGSFTLAGWLMGARPY